MPLSATSNYTGLQPYPTGPIVILPHVVWGSSSNLQSSPSTLDNAAGGSQRLTLTGINRAIPIVYGQTIVGARLLTRPAVLASYLILACGWCEGTIEGLLAIYINDESLPNGVTATNYDGSQTAINTNLGYAFGAQFTEYWPGTAYSVIMVSPQAISGFPRITAKVKGRKLYDPRKDSTNGGTGSHRLATPSTWEWSNNPGLAIADFLRDPTYGCGWTVDWASVIVVANACDTLVGGEKKRIIDLVMEEVLPVDEWVEVLATYAGCWVIRDGTYVRLVPDVDGTTVASYTAANIVSGSLSVMKSGIAARPNMVQCYYTDISRVPYEERSTGGTYAAGISPGNKVRPQDIRLPGITRFSQAKREEIERLNRFMLCDTSVKFNTFDLGVKTQVGDLISLTYTPYGISAKPFRVTEIGSIDTGRWSITATEHDPLIYSSSVQEQPTYPDSSLPNPLEVPNLSGLSATEELFKIQSSGVVAARIIATWTAASWEYFDSYQVTILDAGIAIEGPSRVYAERYVSGPLTEGRTYTIKVAAASKLAVGTQSIATHILVGKLALPANVPAIRGAALNDEVRLEWDVPNDLDLAAYEIRYGATSSNWATSTFLTRVAHPQTNYVTRQLSPSTWRFFVKSLDNVVNETYPFGQECADAAYVDVEVLASSTSFSLPTHAFIAPTLTNMVAYIAGGITNWITDIPNPNQSYVQTGYVDTNNATDTFGDAMTDGYATPLTRPMADPHYSATSTWLGEPWDLGAIYSASVIISWDYTDLAGTALPSILVSTDSTNGTDGTWTEYTGTVIQIAARWIKPKIISTGTLLVESCAALVQGEVKSEFFSGQTDVNGKCTIALVNSYMNAKSIVLTGTESSFTGLSYHESSINLSANRGLRTGRTVLFDGSDDRISVPDAAPLRLSTNLTYECWFKINALPAAGQVGSLMRKDMSATPGPRRAYGLYITDAGVLTGAYYDGTTNHTASKALTLDGLWHHAAVTINDTDDRIWLFLDGIFVNDGVTLPTTRYPATGIFSIGAYTTDQSTWLGYFAGLIDDVRVWNTARTQAQLQANKDIELVGNESGLVGYWKLNTTDQTSNIATDSTSNANHGTATNFGTSHKWRPYDGFVVFAWDAAGASAASKYFSGQFTGF